MKIKEIRAATVDLTPRPRTQPRVPKQPTEGFVSPMARYPEFKRSDWSHPWHRTACLVTADDGTFGLGVTVHAGPVQEIVNGHFAGLLRGQDCMATEKCWDVMRRASASYGTYGLPSYAISAVDNALWDIRGKFAGQPVYRLLGGPTRTEIPAYASMLGFSHEPGKVRERAQWAIEQGFRAQK